MEFVFYFLNQSSSYISNAADFSRSATKPRDPLIGHLITFPIANLVNTIVGFIILGSSVILFGEVSLFCLADSLIVMLIMIRASGIRELS